MFCHRSGSLCCKGDSITETNTGKELRRFQFSVLQTPRNENNLCNLNRINLNAPKGSGGLFLGCKHCHPDFGNDRLKVQSSVEVHLWPCRVRTLSRMERQKQTQRGGVPSQPPPPGRLLLHPVSQDPSSQRGTQSRPVSSTSLPSLEARWWQEGLVWQVEPAVWDAWTWWHSCGRGPQ